MDITKLAKLKQGFSSASEKILKNSKSVFEKTKVYGNKVIETGKETIEKADKALTSGTKKAAVFIDKKANDLEESLINIKDQTLIKIEERKEIAGEELHILYKNAINNIDKVSLKEFYEDLGDSPVELDINRSIQIKNIFPIPREQFIVWADIDFGLRPNGIVLTDKGVFIRTESKIDKDKLNKIISKSKDNSSKKETNKSNLFYYKWEDFEPAWFTSDSVVENKALLVSENCRQIFIKACRMYLTNKENKLNNEINVVINNKNETKYVNSAISTTTGVTSSSNAVFIENNSLAHGGQGQGIMAEEGNNLVDRLLGRNAKILGRDNAKNGADRFVDGYYVQTKYYKAGGKASVDACFDSTNGMMKYIHDGKPMQIEVPKDQYNDAILRFREKISAGKVEGVTNPDDAKKYIRKGAYTYEGACNLAKAGTIESITFDIAQGAVVCSFAFGISALITCYLTFRNTHDWNKSLKEGWLAGSKVFGLGLFNYVVINQVARTEFSHSLIAPTEKLLGNMSTETASKFVNAHRALAGQEAIQGEAAKNAFGKILRSDILSGCISFAVFSIPETYHLLSRDISGSQYIKNLLTLGGSMLGATAGAVGTGLAASAIAGAAGTAINPIAGTAIGMAGGLVGGIVGSAIIKKIGDFFYEDDEIILGRLLNAYIQTMASDYFLDNNEINQLVDKLGNIDSKVLKKFFMDLQRAKNQESHIKNFLRPYFEEIVNQREKFEIPEVKKLSEILAY